MAYLLFIVYLVVCSWLLTRSRFIKNSGLGSKIIILLFLVKVGAGVVGGRMSEFHADSDSWGYHRESVNEYHLLFTQPREYFSNLFFSGYADGHKGLFRFKDSYWNDLKNNLPIKIFSLLNIFSGGLYYVNVILFNFLLFFGNVALFRGFNQLFGGHTVQIVISSFLLPSLLFFGSALHKDGMIFSAIGIVVFCTYNIIYAGGLTFKRAALILLAMILIFLLRNFIFLALLPALAAWFIAAKKKYPAGIVYLLVYVISITIFFNVHRVLPSFDLAGAVVQKQTDFLATSGGHTFIGTPQLQPTFTSFLFNTPSALSHIFFRPYFSDIGLSGLLLPLAFELLLYQLSFVLFLFFRKRGVLTTINKPFLFFCLFFSISVLLITGYTVPIIGAFARYRSIYLPFLLTPLFCLTDWSKILLFLRIKK